MGIVDKAKQAAIAATVTKALDYLEKDPETNIPKIMEMVDKVTPDGWYAGQRNAIRHSIEAKDNWYQLILRMYQLDAGVRQTFFRNFIVNASLKGSATQEKVSEENDCNVPWAILLDPTSACNLHCTGCWAAENRVKNWEPICTSTQAVSLLSAKKTLLRSVRCIRTASSFPSQTELLLTKNSVRKCSV